MKIEDKIKDFKATLVNELDICVQEGDDKKEDTAMILYIIKKFNKLFKNELTDD